MNDWEDTKLIECFLCKKPLNGLSLWVVEHPESEEPATLCEECYAKDLGKGLKCEKE